MLLPTFLLFLFLYKEHYLWHLYWNTQMKYTTYIALHLLNTLKYLHYFTVQCLHYLHCYSHHLYYEFVFLTHTCMLTKYSQLPFEALHFVSKWQKNCSATNRWTYLCSTLQHILKKRCKLLLCKFIFYIWILLQVIHMICSVVCHQKWCCQWAESTKMWHCYITCLIHCFSVKECTVKQVNVR